MSTAAELVTTRTGWRNSAWVGSGAYEPVSGLFRLQAALPGGLYIAGLTRNGEALTDARNRCQVRSYAVTSDNSVTPCLASMGTNDEAENQPELDQEVCREFARPGLANSLNTLSVSN